MMQTEVGGDGGGGDDRRWWQVVVDDDDDKGCSVPAHSFGDGPWETDRQTVGTDLH